jgi:hypothetical protein
VNGRQNASFFWSENDGDIFLNYSAIPEPAAFSLIVSLLALGLAVRRRRKILKI